MLQSSSLKSETFTSEIVNKNTWNNVNGEVNNNINGILRDSTEINQK